VPKFGILFPFFIFFSFSFLAQGQSVPRQIEKADSLYYLDYPEESDDRLAIQLYSQVLDTVPEPDQLEDFVRSFENLGNLQVVYGKLSEAKRSYRKAISLIKSFDRSDTLVYGTHLFLGEVLFRMSRLDSALFHLKEAERIKTQLSLDPFPERLYNALGVYYFETGNYLQSIQYFSKAESFLDSYPEDYTQYARYSFLSNKASALYQLEKYDSARAIYTELLDWEINSDQVRINLANTFLKEGRGQLALDVLDKIESVSGLAYLSFLNLRTKAYLQLSNLDSASKLLEMTIHSFDRLDINSKNYQRGVFFSNYGRFYTQKGSLDSAIFYYHRAINELHPTFDSSDIFQNPDELSLGMGAVSLFENLVAKAELSWEFFMQNNSKEYFSLGLNTYESAFELAEFISANFDNDEARIFLGDQALQGYRKALRQLSSIAKDSLKSELGELAFLWAERSKSTALRLGVVESKQRQNTTLPKELIDKERLILQRIAKNYRDQYKSVQGDELQNLREDYNDLQVRLSRLRDEIKEVAGGYESSNDLVLEQIRNMLSSDELVLSIFENETSIDVFLVGSNVFEWKVLDWDETKRDDFLSWKEEIRNWKSGSIYTTPDPVEALSFQIFDGWQDNLKSASSLIIIPHGVFSGISFDDFMIRDQMLLEILPVSYQYSALQLSRRSLNNLVRSEMISMAPFSKSEGPNGTRLSVLPGSYEEIKYLPGEHFFDGEASLERFLRSAPEKRIIHLATHAVASDEDGDASFVAFYPDGDFRLFEDELRFQPLDKVELVFLSACETASGKFSESEGLVSLARAFQFAGADNLIATLWLAEDQVANYISQQFYYELEQGSTYAEALQKAKLSLLKDPEMAQYRDAPYWTNFVLVGQIQEKSILNSILEFSWIMALLLVFLAFFYWFYGIKQK